MPKSTKAIKVGDRNKSWNKKKGNKRAYQNEYKVIKSFLIICEGKNTETEYFEKFPVSTAKVEAYGGHGQRIPIVNYAIQKAKSKEYKDSEVWCVFDMDFKGDNPNIKQEFNTAIQLAQNPKLKNIKVAYSNDAFELWFVLHYQYLDSNCLRHQYYKILSDLWDLNYEKKGKEKKFCEQLYKKLENDEKANQTQAIKWAKKLQKTYLLKFQSWNYTKMKTYFRVIS